MAFKGRIQRLEASLSANKKFLLGLEHAKRAAAWDSYWIEQLNRPSVPFEWFADEGAYMLWHLINDVNLAILRNAQTNTDLRHLVHCGLDGVLRQIASPDDSGVFVPVCPITELSTRLGEYLYAKLQAIFEEAFCLAAPIDELSEIYLGVGQDILFADSRTILEDEMSCLRTTAETFAPLAGWLNVQPIAMEGYMPGHPMVDAKVTKLADLSRADALIHCDDQRRFSSGVPSCIPSADGELGQRSHSSKAPAPHA
ncbi:MAG: hypothetical protein ACM34E_03505 [Acidobacteriota bacterium]